MCVNIMLQYPNDNTSQHDIDKTLATQFMAVNAIKLNGESDMKKSIHPLCFMIDYRPVDTINKKSIHHDY